MEIFLMTPNRTHHVNHGWSFKFPFSQCPVRYSTLFTSNLSGSMRSGSQRSRSKSLSLCIVSAATASMVLRQQPIICIFPRRRVALCAPRRTPAMLRKLWKEPTASVVAVASHCLADVIVVGYDVSLPSTELRRTVGHLCWFERPVGRTCLLNVVTHFPTKLCNFSRFSPR